MAAAPKIVAAIATHLPGVVPGRPPARLSCQRMPCAAALSMDRVRGFENASGSTANLASVLTGTWRGFGGMIFRTTSGDRRAVASVAERPRRGEDVVGRLPPPRSHLDTLYGQQEGYCGGCGEHFRKRNLTVDHIVARAHGGTDHIDNLWLLCAACNSSKGTRSQEQFLTERMKHRVELFPWLVR